MTFRLPFTVIVLVAGVFTTVLPAHSAEDQVVAIVNGEEIHMSEVREAINYLPPQYQSAPFEGLYPHLVNRLVSMRLIAAQGRAEGMEGDDSFRQKIEHAKNRLLEQMMVEKEIAAKLTDQALQDYYEQWAVGKQSEEEVQARHILLATEAEARDVIAELQKGADFAELAKQRSTGPSGPDGGYLGYFGKGQMVPEFESAAFALNPGEFTTEPVQTQFGYHVILVEDRRKAPVPALEDVADELRNELRASIEKAYVASVRKDAAIQTFNMDGTPAARTSSSMVPRLAARLRAAAVRKGDSAGMTVRPIISSMRLWFSSAPW